ncbi:MAG: DUF6427 family protein [Urechidicola sp.]|nr:DUF6427 family protein [Urechidicola sp.]
MIANFFQKTKPIHAIIISGLFLVYFLAAIFFVEQPPFSFLLILKKLGLLLVFLVLFFIVRFINRKNYLSEMNAYVLLILAMLFGTFPRSVEMNDLFIAHFLLLFSFRRIYSVRTFKSVNQKLFDSGFWIGIATLFYSWSAVFMLLVFATALVHKKNSIRIILIPIVGFVTPLFLAFTYFFLTDDVANFYQKLTFIYSFDFYKYLELTVLVPIAVWSLLIFMSIGLVSIRLVSLSNDLKQSWLLVIIHFLCAGYIIIMTASKGGSELLFLFFPVAIMLTNYLQLLNRNIFREIVVYTLLVLSLSAYAL